MNKQKHTSATSYIGNSLSYCENKKADIKDKVALYGMNAATNLELARLMLESGAKKPMPPQTAHEVLDCLYKTEAEDVLMSLCAIKGLNNEKATIVAASIELGKRMYGKSGLHVTSPEEFVPLVQHYTLESQEHFVCATLNGAHEVQKIRVISVGTLNRTLVHPREVFCDALKDRCAAVIVCHNHPSGNLVPSKEDKIVTQQLKEAAELLNITLLDHIIISQNGHFSFLGAGLLKKERDIYDVSMEFIEALGR